MRVGPPALNKRPGPNTADSPPSPAGQSAVRSDEVTFASGIGLCHRCSHPVWRAPSW